MGKTSESSQEPAVLVLGERLDLVETQKLKTELSTRQGQDLRLDGSALIHIGALGVQLLRAAARSWSEAGLSLTLENASQDTADQLSLLGFTPADVTKWEGRA